MKTTLRILALVVIAAFAYFWNTYTPPLTKEYSLTTIEVVDTAEAQVQGLSGRADVPPDYGMLFVFDEKKDHAFWMKDMLVSIDIIWLSDEGVIQGITPNVSPDTYPEAFHPPEPGRYVLETRAGEASARGWEVGTKLNLPLP